MIYPNILIFHYIEYTKINKQQVRKTYMLLG